MKAATEVLIVGAGPTGLVLALWLANLGIKFRIVDKAAEPGTTSRALAVHARTLEFYGQVDLSRQVVDSGLPLSGAVLWVAGRKRGQVIFGDMGRDVSAFPYVLMFPQDEHERLLIDRLQSLGVTVERSVEVANIEDLGTCVGATLRDASGGEERIETAFLVGCDGAHSVVRGAMSTGFPGGTYSHVFYVADVEAHGPAMNRELNLALDAAEFLAIFPLKGSGRARLIGSIQRDADAPGDLAFDDVSSHIFRVLKFGVDRVNWFSTYRVHHRVAASFRRGRVFLAGDAAHIHSPVGGQGMNTGIGDAVNLAWKLAAVLRGRADEGLLESYEPERIAFARRLVATTDRAFQLINDTGAMARFIRLHVIPVLLPALFNLSVVRRLMFRTISQTNVDYRGSALSGETGSAPGLRATIQAGDRLPWVPGDAGADNFEPLRSLNWQAHVYGEASAAISFACAQAQLDLQQFSWSETAHRHGILRGAFYLVRPDGYIAFIASALAAVPALHAYQAKLGLVFASHADDGVVSGRFEQVNGGDEGQVVDRAAAQARGEVF